VSWPEFVETTGPNCYIVYKIVTRLPEWMPGFTCTDTLYTDRQVSRLLVFIGCGLWIGSAICASWLTTVSTAQQHAVQFYTNCVHWQSFMADYNYFTKLKMMQSSGWNL